MSLNISEGIGTQQGSILLEVVVGMLVLTLCLLPTMTLAQSCLAQMYHLKVTDDHLSEHLHYPASECLLSSLRTNLFIIQRCGLSTSRRPPAAPFELSLQVID